MLESSGMARFKLNLESWHLRQDGGRSTPALPGKAGPFNHLSIHTGRSQQMPDESNESHRLCLSPERITSLLALLRRHSNCAKSIVTREGFERAAKAYVAPEVGLPWQNG